jgi:hypothetical protein
MKIGLFVSIAALATAKSPVFVIAASLVSAVKSSPATSMKM